MIDLLIVLIIVSYAISGYRQGLVVGTLSLGGFVLGAVLAMISVPPLADRLDPGLQRSFAVLLAVLLFAWLGQLLGALLGVRLRDAVTLRPAQVVDQLLGGLAGILAVTLVLWFIAGALRGSPSPVVARAVASSKVLAGVQELMPSPVVTLAQGFRDAVAGSSFPRVFAGIAPEQILPVESPNPRAVSTKTLRLASRGIVKITGEAEACGRGQEGSGSVVARGHVVTNAHVVAGMRTPQVQVTGVGQRYRATVVAFDPRRDLAVLRVPDLPADTRVLPPGRDLEARDDALVVGFPLNGALKPEPARVRTVMTAVGEDIYGGPRAVREIYSLYTKVEPGNSGGPVLNKRGQLVGIVFAKSLDDASTGYALTMQESGPVIRQGLRARAPVSTGRCANG